MDSTELLLLFVALTAVEVDIQAKSLAHGDLIYGGIASEQSCTRIGIVVDNNCIRTLDQRLHHVFDGQVVAGTDILAVLGRLNLHELKLRVDTGKSSLQEDCKDSSENKY